MYRTRILVVEEDVLFRESLVQLLSAEEDLLASCACATSAEAIDMLKDAAPDVILFDTNRRPDAAFDFIRNIRHSGFIGRILLITAVTEPRWSARVLQAGAAGIFLRSRGLKKLLHAIKLVASGETWVERDVIEVLAHGVPNVLTERESDVLGGVTAGLTNRAIAEKLGVSEATVKFVLRRLFRRSGVRSRAQLIRATLERQ